MAWQLPVCMAMLLCLSWTAGWAQTAAEPASAPVQAMNGAATSASASVSASGPQERLQPPQTLNRRWVRVPRVWGHLSERDLGVVINTDDPYSVEVAQAYVRKRHIPADQVLRVQVPVKAAISLEEFNALKRSIDQFYGDRVQALVLAWRWPYAVGCQSITGVLALGWDPHLCASTCAPPQRVSPYFNSASTRPFRDFGMRISMLLAANDVPQAQALIDRGLASDNSLGLRGGLPVVAHFVATSDAVRSVRQGLFPPPTHGAPMGVEVALDHTDALRDAHRVLLYITGRVSVDALDSVDFVPGALADHLTSFGGVLQGNAGQMTVLSWIQAGATASYGTVSEPCNHWQKFPHPQALLLFYMQGATAIEAYWKSVYWPQQGVFVGEPLAAPFARDVHPGSQPQPQPQARETGPAAAGAGHAYFASQGMRAQP